MTDTILITGVTGFIASHVTAKCLDAGYNVRGTARNLNKVEHVVGQLKAAGHNTDNLELVEADLSRDEGWAEAVKDCRFIQHIASPFPIDAPRDREALVPEARAGAMRVLEHGLGAGAERIIMTSSLVAMMGQPGRGATMTITEQDWSDPDWKPLRAYAVSKTRAEKAAWDYVKRHDLEDRLTTVNPGLVLGPDSFDNSGASLELIKLMFAGEFPRVPKLAYPIIDVRDCAAIHVAAMTAEGAGGRRLMAAGKTLWFKEIAQILRGAYPDAKKLPKGDMPDMILRMIGLFDDRVKGIMPDLCTFHVADAAYVSALTKVIPRPAKEAVLAAAESLKSLGRV